MHRQNSSCSGCVQRSSHRGVQTSTAAAMGRDCMWELCKGGWAWGLNSSSRVRWCFLFRKTQSQGLFWARVREKLKLSHGLCIKNCNPEFGSVCSEDTVVLFLIGMSWLFSGPLLSWSYNTIAFFFSLYFLSLWFCVCALRYNGNRHWSHELWICWVRAEKNEP